jgi:hypothetical protein
MEKKYAKMMARSTAKKPRANTRHGIAQEQPDMTSTSTGSSTAKATPHIPHSPDAEIGLINLAVRDAQCLYKMQEAGIQPEHFFSEYTGTMYALLTSLTDQGKGAHPGKFNIIQASSGTIPQTI